MEQLNKNELSIKCCDLLKMHVYAIVPVAPFEPKSIITMFGTYTGQRTIATTKKVTIGQFRQVLCMEKPAVEVLPEAL